MNIRMRFLRAMVWLLVLACPSTGSFSADLELAASHPAPDSKDVPVSASIHLRCSTALQPSSLQGLTLQELSGDAARPIAVERATDLTNALEVQQARLDLHFFGAPEVPSVS
jgi:hypothetical protein